MSANKKDIGEILKVMCRTCGNEVKYRPPVDAGVKKRKVLERLMKKRQRKMEGIPEEKLSGPGPLRQLWDELTDKVDARYARVYESTKEYDVEDALLHKKHGMGIIHDIHGDGTLNVLFRTGFIELPSGEEPTLD